jgi:hypothetical protein
VLAPVLHYFLEAVRSCASVVGVTAAELGLWLVTLSFALVAALAWRAQARTHR